MDPTPQETAMTFPCDIAVKVMGKNQPEFIAAILPIFRRYFPALGEAAIKTRDSKNEKFLSLTITVTAASKAQMDELYQELTSNEQCLFVL